MKKRKIFLTALTLVMSICLLLAFVGCDQEKECMHEWQNTSVLTQPTCTAGGTQEQKCTKCGDVQTVEIPSVEHDFAETWTSDENGHWHECTRDDCTAKQDQDTHSENKNHTCTTCKTTISECADTDNDHNCDLCGSTLSECADKNDDHNCDTCGTTVSQHTGGTASCQQKATCTICGNQYGELGAHDFDETTWAKDTTNHWHACKTAGCTQKSTEEDHPFENGFCSTCGGYQSAVKNGEIYEISNAGQLYWFAQLVNGVSTDGTQQNTSAKAKLMADIDLGGKTWYPIGVYEDPAVAGGKEVKAQFIGSFDGNFHIVSNFTAIGNGSQGLLGYLSKQASVKNIGVTNATVSAWNAGAVVGFAGTLENCFAVNCTITGYSTINSDPIKVSPVGGNGYTTNSMKSCFAYNCTVNIDESEESYYMHPVAGAATKDPTRSNCYYAEITTNTTYTSTKNATEVTKTQLASGEVTYLLNGSVSEGTLAWKQTIGTHQYPGFTGSVVYCDARYGSYCNAPQHTGGTATCTEKATCTVCDQTYGEIDSTNHGTLVWTKDSTTHNGVCQICEVVVVEGVHKWENGVCTVCGNYDTYGTAGICYKYDATTETYYVYGYDIYGYEGKDTEVTIARYQYAEDTGLKPVTSVGYGAFDSKAVTKVVIPNTVTRIEQRAFQFSTSLTEIVIPDTIEYIGFHAFYYTPWCETYLEKQPDGDIYIGKVLYTYKGTMPENYTLDIKAGTKSISSNTYNEQMNLSVINMPASLEIVGYQAFNDCSGIKTITIGENVKAIENYAFYGCMSAQSIVLNSKLETIGDSAFYLCRGVKTLTIPSNVKTIGSSTFAMMDLLESVVIEGSGLTSIGESSFTSCEKLTSVTFSVSLEKLKEITCGVWYKDSPNVVIYYEGGSFKVHYDKVDATCTEDGNIEYWYNFLNGKYYSNKFFASNSVIEGSVVLPGGHTGGTATCQQKAVCTTCGEEYGDFATHDFDEDTWIQEKTSHYQICNTAGCTERQNEGEHTYGDDEVCTICSFDPNTLGTQGITYAYNAETQTYTVTGYSGTKTAVFIHETYDDGVNGEKAVTSVESSAFSGNATITSVVIPNTVTAIAAGAFNGCSSLVSITIPFVGAKAGVTANDTYQYPFGYIFGETAYEGGVSTSQDYYGKSTSSTVTTSYYIPESLITVNVTGGNILYGAFYGCNLITDVVLPNGITTIGECAFYKCSKLKNANIPNSVTLIDKFAFYDCTSLGNVTFPSGLTKIGWASFFACKSITSIVIPEGVTEIDGSAFRACSTASSISIPDSVTTIGDYAFFACNDAAYTEYDNAYYLGNEDNPYLVLAEAKNTTLTSCDIAIGTKFIHSYAFAGCALLESVTIPNGVVSISIYAFYNCSSLQSVLIPDSVKTIEQEAFYSNTSLTQVTIGSGITRIDDNAFENCTALTRVDISDVAAWCNIEFGVGQSNPLYYAKNLYLNNTLVKDLVIPEGVTEIKQDAFNNATCIKTVTLPTSVTTIGTSAFHSCSGLTGVYITDIVAWLNIDINDTGNSLLSRAGNLYLNDTLVEYLIIPENKGITEIKRYAFMGATCLKNVTIPEGVTSIGTSAFWNCNNLNTVNIPNSLTTIGQDVFRYCSKLKGTKYDNAQYLGNDENPYLVLYKAMDYQNITTCDIHTDTKIILSDAFDSCEKLAAITIPEGVTEIQSSAFRFCTELQSIVIPDSVKTLGYSAFSNCTKLSSVTLSNSLTSVGNYTINRHRDFSFFLDSGAAFIVTPLL